MKDRHRFRPAGVEPLEGRAVPAAGGLIAPVAVRPVPVVRTSLPDLYNRVTALVNQAFDAFTADYLQAQGTYLAAVNTPNTNAPAAFQAYIRQRVQLLSAQLVRAFSQVPGSFNRLPSTFGGSGGPIVLQAFLRRVIGVPRGGQPDGAPGTLLNALLTNVPVMGAVATPAATLYTLDATTAIETARTATVNGVRFLVHHTFENGHPA
jgi:hypothetical protein